jgi:hypothetical protein
MALLPINITASTTLDDRHAGTTCTINAAAGLTITLPAASGSGRVFELVLGTTVTSNNVIIQVANANDTMTGQADMAQDAGDTEASFETLSNSDTLTLNGSTKGGIKGDKIILKDIQSTLWSVDAELSGTGTEITPFSAAV